VSYRYNPPSATPSASRRDIETEFRRWNQQADEAVISDFALPMHRAGQTEVLVVFLLRGQQVRVRIDAWGDFATNLRCAYLNIRAMRLAEARGSLDAMRETFMALPAPAHGQDPWEVLGLRSDADPVVIEATYKALAKQRHPDAGGSEEEFKALQAAYEAVKP